MTDNENYYMVLEVDSNASFEDIKKAYKRLALKYHPDKNPGYETEARERFQAIHKAYKTLNDPEARNEYDFSILNQQNTNGSTDQGYHWNNWWEEIDSSSEEEIENEFQSSESQEALFKMLKKDCGQGEKELSQLLKEISELKKMISESEKRLSNNEFNSFSNNIYPRSPKIIKPTHYNEYNYYR